MKIVLLITGLGLGGAERQVCDLADQFAHHDHDVTIMYLTGEATLLPGNGSIRVIGLGMRKTSWSFLATYYRLCVLVRSIKPDVVHSHMVHANIMARLLRLCTGIPHLICTAHNTNEGGALRMLAYRLTDFLADISTNVSQEAVDAFIAKKAVPKNKMITMYNGIDTHRFCFNALARRTLRKAANMGEADTLLLCVGRLNAQKDYPTMLHAFQRAYQKNDSLTLWIVGMGDQLPLLLQLVKNLKIEEKVRFLGLRHDIPELMSACDIFCLSSAYEGFGLVVAEAMACERLVVATDCGGIKEVIGDSGILVNPKSSEDLAQGISEALKKIEYAFYDSKKIEVRKRVIHYFSLATMTKKWLNLYQKKGTYGQKGHEDF